MSEREKTSPQPVTRREFIFNILAGLTVSSMAGAIQEKKLKDAAWVGGGATAILANNRRATLIGSTVGALYSVLKNIDEIVDKNPKKPEFL